MRSGGLVVYRTLTTRVNPVGRLVHLERTWCDTFRLSCRSRLSILYINISHVNVKYVCMYK